MTKPKPYHNCTILRTVMVTEYRLNIVTGATCKDRTYVSAEPCNAPLFTEDEKKTGICRTCQSGWETTGNEFANEEERARAAIQKARDE